MRILVGYDGSNVAKEALELARKRAMVWGAKIYVVNCMAQNRELKYKDMQICGFPVNRGRHAGSPSDSLLSPNRRT